MAHVVNRINGQNYADNIANPALTFETGTWTVASGSGTVVLNADNYIEGESSLRIQNNTPASDIIVTNSDQDTAIPTAGDYQISWFLKKDIAEEVRVVDVLIYQNAVRLDTQTCTLGSTDADEDINDTWVRFQADQNYNLGKGDDITFQFTLKSAITAEITTFVYVDGLMVNKAGRGNTIVPSYVKPIGEKAQSFGIYDYNDNATSTTPIAVSASTWTALTNDGAGAFTNKTYSLNNILDVWDTSGNLFDFSGLELGDEVVIRFMAKITTNSANQTVKLRLKAAMGTGSEYDIPFITAAEFKTATEHDLPSYGSITMLNTETLNNGARFEIFTDDTADVEVIGWQCVVRKRLI